jgi:hypothetical protein
MRNKKERKQIMNLVAELIGYQVPSLENIQSRNNDFIIDFDKLKRDI